MVLDRGFGVGAAVSALEEGKVGRLVGMLVGEGIGKGGRWVKRGGVRGREEKGDGRCSP